MPALSAEIVRGGVRALGARGTLAAIAGVAIAGPFASSPSVTHPRADARVAWRAAQRDAVIEGISAYSAQILIYVGPPFSHTRPQWILPHGGKVTLDGGPASGSALRISEGAPC